MAVVTAYAQGDGNTQSNSGRVTPKELSIPASPVFDLMGVTPSQVTRTSDIKDFKVDWSFKSWKLNPNLAIQSQPFWEIFYNRKGLEKYQRASGFMRRLASVDLSIGTVQNEESDRRIGAALKINLFKKGDPLLAKELYIGVAEKYNTEKAELETQLKALQRQLDTTQNILEKPAIRNSITGTEEQLLSINSRRNEEINARAKIFVQENWNASWLDIALGKVNTYASDSAGSLVKLRLNRNTAWGFWLNGGMGIGKHMLASALIRTSVYEEQVDFLLRDVNTDEQTTQQAVADNQLWSLGFNLRYGGSLYSFFTEFFYERKSFKTALKALNESFQVPSDNLEVVESSVQWTTVHPYTINFGGDWRVSRNLILNYGMRCLFDKKWKMQTFTPVVSISCMMR
jgi:phage shock protein A